MFNGSNQNPAAIIAQVQVTLLQIRDAMNAATALGEWGAGVSLDELTAPPAPVDGSGDGGPYGPGMNSGDAQAVLSACADAAGLASLYNTGTDPRNPPAGYNYGASQRLVIGPRPR